MFRRIVVPLALAAGLVTAGSAAEARDGCGPGFHRGFYGWCRPNLGFRPLAYGPVYRRFGHHGWGGRRWHYSYHYSWHRRFGWHGGGHRWGGFRHAGSHHRW
ncbi:MULTISPECIES: hypothetical protein [Methylobacterium]|uniref:Sulfur globule protein n=1 Tax=Methylobacterium cerastii TaxID=932741 RepID=A0ABQ4QN76_9HYPH|nr:MULTISPECIES: hypothetical protein [Methylobacterium]MCK2057026.1 hypothetical protein [Methylobacterium sp. 37f]TXM64392.1 hypothetical protein FV229_18765 [Methylobacterium sp. WL120]TXM70770.1 hypothetical protein FV226_16500 [Methylobacterium sp. WL12]GJD46707.1 hypothetical protein AFCDBAGC_4591 [Methylobacterium cerastii]